MNSINFLKTPIDQITFSVIDTETTGMNHTFNRVCDIGIITVRNGQIIDEWEALINPEQKISYWISTFTNIYDYHVQNKQPFNVHIKKIQTLINDTVFVGHNVDFDYSFLSSEFIRAGQTLDMQKLCTIKLGRRLLPNLPNLKLDSLANHFDLKITKRHRALPDAKATALSLIELIKIAKEKYNVETLYDLQKVQQFKIFPEDYPKFGLDLF